MLWSFEEEKDNENEEEEEEIGLIYLPPPPSWNLLNATGHKVNLEDGHGNRSQSCKTTIKPKL